MLARLTLTMGILSLASLLLGPLLSSVRVLGPLAGFGLTAGGMALGVTGLLVGIVAVDRGGWDSAFPGLVLCGAVALAAGVMWLRARRYPTINDISTDTATPPEFVSVLSLTANHGRDMTYPGESFARQQRAAYPDIAPLTLDLSPPEALTLVERVARSMPSWDISDVDHDTHSIEATAETPVFHFVDDIVIQVRPEDGKSVIHMRSRSREGKGDLGTNTRRIREFLAGVQEQSAARK